MIKLSRFLVSSNNLMQGGDMFNNKLTVDVNFAYDAHMQSYPNTMNDSSLQTLNFDSNVSPHSTSIRVHRSTQVQIDKVCS